MIVIILLVDYAVEFLAAVVLLVHNMGVCPAAVVPLVDNTGTFLGAENGVLLWVDTVCTYIVGVVEILQLDNL